MKFCILNLSLLLNLFVFAQGTNFSLETVHPEIYKVLKNYNPLQKGGYRIEKFNEGKYIVVGIGKAVLKNNFIKAQRAAEIDAELQIAKALNPTHITVENHRSKKTIVSSDKTVESKTIRQKFIQMLISSHTPFVYSCGTWQRGKYIYYAKAVFVGKFEHKNKKSSFKPQIINLNDNNKTSNIITNFSYLSYGGTFLIDNNTSKQLLTVAVVPNNLPPSRKLTFARNQAYKNFIAFISGTKLEQQLTVISEHVSSNKEKSLSRKSKRKNLEASIKGEFQFITPVAKWNIHNTKSEFYLYIIQFKEI